jgi:hypothetical protein
VRYFFNLIFIQFTTIISCNYIDGMIYHGCSNVFGVYIYDKALSIYLKISKQQHIIQFVCLFLFFLTIVATNLWIHIFSVVRVTWSLVLCVCFVDRCLSFCTFSFGHCVVCSSSVFGFWLPSFGIFKLFLQNI